MFLQPPGEPYLIPHPFFSSPHFIYQGYVQAQPYSQAQICVPNSFYHVYPTHPFPPYYIHRPAPNPSINPRELLPRPRRNTRIKPRSEAASTSCVRKWVPKRKLELTSTSVRTRSAVHECSSLIPFPTSPHQQITSTAITLMIKNIPNHFGYSTSSSLDLVPFWLLASFFQVATARSTKDPVHVWFISQN